MKNLRHALPLFLFLTVACPTAFSGDLKDFLNNPDAKTYWLVSTFRKHDYLEIRLSAPRKSGTRHFKSINELVLFESDKYNVAKSFRKTKSPMMSVKSSVLTAKTDTSKILTSNETDLAHVNKALVERW
jgi:hypothetical protein